jgi:hypothetical protein
MRERGKICEERAARVRLVRLRSLRTCLDLLEIDLLKQ